MAQDQKLQFSILAKVVGAQAVTDLKNQVASVGKAAGGIQKDFGALTGALKALAGAYAIREGIQFAKNLLDTADKLDEVAQRTGTSASELAKFSGAAELSGVGIDGLAKAMQKLALAQVEAKSGTEQFRAAFQILGVLFQDVNGALRPSGEVLKDIADRFSTLPDGAEKAALAVKLFGKSGTELIPVLNQGADSLERFGLNISDDFAARAGQFNDSITQLGNSFKSSFIEGLEAALPALQEVVNAFKDTTGESDLVVTAFEGIGEAVRLLGIAFTVFVDTFANGVDSIIVGARLMASYVQDYVGHATNLVTTLASQLASVLTGDLAGAAAAEKKFQDESLARSKKFADERGAITDNYVKRVKDRANNIESVTKRLSANSLLLGYGTVEEIRQRQKDATAVAPRRATGAAPDVSGLGGSGGASKLQNELNAAKALREAGLQEIEIEKLKLEAYKYSGAELERLTAIKKSDIEVTKATKNMTEEGAAAYREAAKAVLDQKLALIDLEEQQKHSFTVGIAQGARDYLEKVQDVASQSKVAFTNAFKGMEDALVGFVKTGKFNFSDLADSIISDIIRIAVRQAVIAPLLGGITGLFSGGGAAAAAGASYTNVAGYAANGGVMTARGFAKLNTYANGGVARTPQLAVFGEGRTPEAYVPLPDGRNIPVKMEGGSSGGDVNVNVQVNVGSAGGDKTSVEGDAQQGKALGNIIANAVKTELINQRRPGGLLA